MSALAAASPQTDVGAAEAYAAQLYERHRRAIFGVCYKQLRRREDADDAVQTTFVYALLSLRRGVVPEMELPWLVTIARNVCSTRRRAGMRRGEYESPQDLDSVQDRLASPERSDVATTADFAAVLQAIPESQRRALLLREWQGLSYDEIGSELGLSQSATEALLFRARQNVAQRLGERTGVGAALQGLPFFSFLRNLLQSAAAKTIAVGAGAAITLVAVPAAQQTADAGKPLHAPAVVQTATARREPSTPVVHRGRPGSVAPARTDVSVPRAARGATPSRHHPSVSSQSAPSVTQPVEPPVSQPASAPPTANNDLPSAPALPAVANVVDTATPITGSLPLPEVSLPEVQTPAITLPVTQTPTVPSVQLP
jgi:RNA polymerase sigma-70 factor, ECF subfamily